MLPDYHCSMRVSVVGAGVTGLTCGVRLLEAGLPVRIVTAAPPSQTTSMVAGALWFPYRGLPNKWTCKWVAQSHAVFQQLVAQGNSAVSIQKLLWLSAESQEEEPWWFAAFPHETTELRTRGLPHGYETGLVVEVPTVRVPAYLDWLLGRFRALGGTIDFQHLHSLAELSEPIVVNCTGLGAHALAGDAELQPVRGQVVYVNSPNKLKWILAEVGTKGIAYVFPHSDQVILGGTLEEQNLSSMPTDVVAQDILARAQRIEPDLQGCTYVGSAVGFRPSRPFVRLERKIYPNGRVVVHNYGHGGSGFSLSWGCAEEVVHLVQNI